MASGKRENDARGRGMSDQSEEVDAAVLQYQNQKLVQQLEAHKCDMHSLEGKFKELKEQQISYDNILITVNRIWNQLVDDLVFLGIRAGGHPAGLQALSHEDYPADKLEECPPEETFLCRLLRKCPVENNGINDMIKFIQEALALRHLSTTDLMKLLQETIATQQAKTESLALALRGNLSSEDAFMQLQKLDESLREQANNLRQAIDVIHQKHKQYADEISNYANSHSRSQSEIKRLSGELEESMAELEESRRKLVILQMQKHGTSVLNLSVVNTSNGSSSPVKPADRTMGLLELKDSVEEAKTLAASRLCELQEAQEDNLALTKQLEDLENEMRDDKYVLSSKPYSLLNVRLGHLNMELEQCRGSIEFFQADRTHLLRREKELNTKVDSAEAAKSSIGKKEMRIEELEAQIQQFITERNDFEMKVEEAEQDSGRQDIKDEYRVMTSALSKEMELMETQLSQSKEAASEVSSLREEADSLRTQLNQKTTEHKSLSDKYAEQLAEIKSLKSQIEKMEKEKQELEIFLDMYGRGCYDNRTITEIKESEHRARAQAEVLRAALDEHSLELRVKAANEAEATCKQRLSAAEAEILELRAKLDDSERELAELIEAIKIKDAEGDAYISEIESIGQAYEDMQTQNQRLLQLVADRDDYNVKLVSDSVKRKQTHRFLLSKKQTMENQLQEVNGSVEFVKSKVTHGEEQLKIHIAQATKASLENRRLVINLDKAKMELADTEKEVKWLRTTYDCYEKEYEQNQKKILEFRMELDRERNERKKLEEEIEEAKGEVMEMGSENEEAAIQKLQDELHLKYGPIVTLHIGSVTAIFISDRSLAHSALVGHGASFSDRPAPVPVNRFISANQHNISSASYGPLWRLLRRNLISEILHPTRVQIYASGRQWVLSVLTQHLHSKSQSPNGVVAVESFHFAMFCLLVLMCFGEKLDEKAILEIEIAQRNLLLKAKKLNMFAFFPRFAEYVFRERLLMVMQLWQRIKELYVPLIRARRAHKRTLKRGGEGEESRYVFSYLDSLLDVELEGGRGLTDDEMVSLCWEFLNAGTDTTSTALQWIMAELVRHPEIQKKLAEEVETVVGSEAKEVSEEELAAMPYLKAVVKEGLRLHPPAHFVLPHAVTEEVEIGGYVIPKDASVNFMVSEMNRDGTVWDEPMEFKPERFVGGGEGVGVDITGSKELRMMPFGVGRRICPAIGLAMLHLEYFVANLMREFEWKTVEGEEVDMAEKDEFTVVMKNPLRACLVPKRKV